MTSFYFVLKGDANIFLTRNFPILQLPPPPPRNGWKNMMYREASINTFEKKKINDCFLTEYCSVGFMRISFFKRLLGLGPLLLFVQLIQNNIRCWGQTNKWVSGSRCGKTPEQTDNKLA